MRRHKVIVLAVVMAAAEVIGARFAAAQTFQTYRCADGTEFIVGFYDQDARAFLQIDGEPVTLARRMAVSGTRYLGAGVTLRIGPAGATTVKHLKRPVTACTVIDGPGL